MKKLALGIATAAALFTAAPAMAFGVDVGVGGVRAGIGVSGPHSGPYYGGYYGDAYGGYYDDSYSGYSGGDCGYDNDCGGPYYDYYDGPSVVIGGGRHHHGWHGHHR